jgi:hypothetical protein
MGLVVVLTFGTGTLLGRLVRIAVQEHIIEAATSKFQKPNLDSPVFVNLDFVAIHDLIPLYFSQLCL